MVSATLMRFVSPCWKPSVEGENSSNGGDAAGRAEGLLWYKDSGQHVNGEFSMAVIQANNLLEDCSQLESGPMSSAESGPHGTFVGVYDGHGGPEAARFVNESLFENIKRTEIGFRICTGLIRFQRRKELRTLYGYVSSVMFFGVLGWRAMLEFSEKFTSENNGMSADVINKAFLATEEEFLSLVKKQWLNKPQIASVGACCLVGVVCGGILYIANAGDSRVVLGRLERAIKEIKAVQLSYEHNASIESVREELHSLHPDDPHIVVLKHKVWRVRGLIQISRSIGDAYLKRAEFNREPLLAKFRLPEPFDKPILKAEPTILVQKLYPEDQFLIFASDGLWEQLSNQEAVDIVHSCPRNGVARKLVKAALCEAAKKRETRYSDLKKIDRGVRRHFHDDITVIVLFLDSNLVSRSSLRGPLISIKGGCGVSGNGNT
uniref:protein-serine/threonine phosphatase n=1 Tax=Salix viminalis TaxID=40686 RepID=A0A6N2M1F2_SALVM